MSDRTGARPTAAVRAGWAIALLMLPERLLRAGGRPLGPAAVAAVRLLGVRHLAQTVLSTRPAMPWALAAVVDTVHAGSCVGLVVVAPSLRRVAAIDALVEAGFAASSWRTWSRVLPVPPRRGSR